jgi:hypothetical protein
VLNGDGDLPRHLVVGEHILQHGPRFADTFSFTRAGEPFLAYEWLSQTVLHLVHRFGGLPAVAAFAGLLVASAVALVVVYMLRKPGGDPWLAFMTGTLSAILMGPHLIARPHLFSFLALPVLLLLLDDERPNVIGIGVLFACWANLHPGFLYGLAIMGVILAGRMIEAGLAGDLHRATWLRYAVLVSVAWGASLLNPFGWSLHVHAIQHAANAELLVWVDEFEPLRLRSLYGLLIGALTAAVAAGIWVQRERIPFDALAAFLVGLVVTFAAQRNGPLLAVAGWPMMARSLTPVVTRLPHWFAGPMRREFKRSHGRSAKATGGAVLILSVVLLLGGRIGGFAIIPAEFSDEDFPVVAVDRAREAMLTGRLLSEYTWGGYVLYAWPEQRVFVDSMADFFGLELLQRYSMMRDAGPLWRELLRSHDISLVLLSHEAPLTERLRREAAWELWHEDPTAIIFRRTSAPPEASGAP